MQPYFDLINHFFDHVYVITLPRAADRHHHIAAELKGLRYQLFWGKDKKDFTAAALQQEGVYNEKLAQKHHRYGKGMPEGMIGCAWSHRLVYEDLIANGYKNALVLEDDVVVEKQLISLLPQMLAELPADWELLYFGFAGNEAAPRRAALKKVFYHLLRLVGLFNYSHATIRNLYPKRVSEHLATAGYHDCTHAYGLTLAAAQKLVRVQQPISYVADNLLAHAVTGGLVKGYITLPKIINQQYQVSNTPTYSYLNQ